MSVHLAAGKSATQAETLEALLERLLSDHAPAIFIADASGQLNREIAVAALEFAKDFRFGDDDDGIVYRLLAHKKPVLFSQILCGERFCRKSMSASTWYQLTDTKFNYVELAGNRPLGLPLTMLQTPLDLQESVTRLRLKLEKQK